MNLCLKQKTGYQKLSSQRHINGPSREMYSYNDLSQVGGSNRPPPSPNQGGNHPNGINGNGALGGMMGAPIPTPAGHQQDLNLIHSMVEEYARLMEENRQSTARVLDAAGRVRQRAMNESLTNEELLGEVNKELNGRSSLQTH